MQASKRRLTLIELNEFSVALLERGVKELGLPHVARMLALKQASTTTDDMVEHRGLDPWVQWVSAHTGVPSSVHGIIHLGDTPADLGFRQVWEVLSERGVSSGVWGAMNATRGDAALCKFFLPDPWTFSERAFPEKLNDLLALPRYYSRNYLDVSIGEFLGNTLRLGKFVLGSGAVARIIAQAPLVLGGVLRNGVNNAVLFSLFDLFSAAIFSAYKRKLDPQLSVIFLNSIAHLQHHKWVAGDRLPGDLAFGLRVIDRVLEIIFDSLGEDEAVVVMNALTQRNIAGEKPRICYRQINPARFLEAVGLPFDSVEQLMTNDAHVFFPGQTQRDHAASALEGATIQGLPLFQVEPNASNPLKLFYQVDFWDELEGDVEVEVGGHRINFLDHFEAIVARTGAHVRDGNVFSSGIALPAKLYNHEIAAGLLGFFAAASANDDGLPRVPARAESSVA
ncbi:MAG: hypothetical protein RR792_00495 [Thermomonas sp.]